MDFSISAALRSTLDTAGSLVERELHPLEPLLFAEDYDELWPRLETVRERVRAEGLWAPHLPAELGGMGLGLVEHGLISEAVGGSPLGHYAFGCQAPDAGNVEILHRHGSAEQKERWLGPLAGGEIRSCFAMTERDTPGSNPVLLATRAVRDGDDWVLDGHKWLTTAADGAAVAIVMAVTDPEAAPHRRATMFLVPTDTPGFERRRNIRVMGEAGSGFFSHAEIVLVECRVPDDQRLGGEGEGFTIAQERLGPGRIHHTMRWLGICRRALDMMCERAAARPIGDGEVLADRQMVRAWIADSAAEIQAARLTTLHAAWTIEQSGWKAARGEISAIKFLVAGILQRVLDRAVQLHGGLGVTDDTPLAFFYRQERAARIYDGPDEVHREALARHLLRPYRR